MSKDCPRRKMGSEDDRPLERELMPPIILTNLAVHTGSVRIPLIDCSRANVARQSHHELSHVSGLSFAGRRGERTMASVLASTSETRDGKGASL
jgi:hypothetical protein